MASDRSKGFALISSPKPKVVAIIQARMGSSRFPGKVLMPLAGKPVLWHIVHRLWKCNLLNDVVVATSTLPSDDPLCEFCREQGIPVVRGPEEDVLERFAVAIRQLDPTVIVRVTGDVPLIDPSTVDSLVEVLLQGGDDYCILDPDYPSLHEGIDPFTREAFERVLVEGKGSAVAREHVSAFFKEHPDRFRIARCRPQEPHLIEGGRFSVDTPADLDFLETIYEHLCSEAGDIDAGDVVKLLREKPSLNTINQHIYQKKATDETTRILIRCDGDVDVGMGHVVRCAALADELRESFGCGVFFAVSKGKPAVDYLVARGFPVHVQHAGSSESSWVANLISGQKPDAIILDVRTDLSLEAVRDWKTSGIFVVVVDDTSDRRLAADAVFFPPVPQVEKLTWPEYSGRVFTGWDWVVLRRQFGGKRSVGSGMPPRILVSMGGSDPCGLSLDVAEALVGVKESFTSTFVIGASFPYRKELEARLAACSFPNELLVGVEEMADLMAASDMAVASFGVTAYELATLGVPAVHLCLTDDHAESSSAFEGSGIAVNLGVAGRVPPATIAEGVSSLLRDSGLRRQMGKRAAELIDGRGARRIAAEIVQRSRGKWQKK